MVAAELYTSIVKQDEGVFSGERLRTGTRVRLNVVVAEGNQRSRGAEVRAMFVQTLTMQ